MIWSKTLQSTNVIYNDRWSCRKTFSCFGEIVNLEMSKKSIKEQLLCLLTVIAITDRGSVTLDCDKSDGGQKREWRPSRFQADSQLSASKGQVETRWSPKLLNHVIRSEGSLFQSTATSVKATSSQGGKSTTSAFRRKKESKAESSSQPSEAAPAKPARSNPALASKLEFGGEWRRVLQQPVQLQKKPTWDYSSIEAV